MITLFRIFKFSWQNFFRNFWLSFVTLTIIFLALASVNVLIVLQLLARSAISTVENRIDVSIYFKSTVKEDQVLNVQAYLSAQEGVSDVTYVSRDQALINFKKKHENDEKILKSLEALGDNPLGAALVIHATDPKYYEPIITALSGDQYQNLIEDKDFEDYRLAIERITKITSQLAFAVTIMAIVFGLISILIVFNTLRVAIYTHRDEIKIMQLVGATNSFILGPYLLEAIWFALIGIIITILVLYPMLGLIQPYITTFFEGEQVNLVLFFNDNFIKVFGLQFLATAGLNIASALIATRKYLRD